MLGAATSDRIFGGAVSDRPWFHSANRRNSRGNGQPFGRHCTFVSMRVGCGAVVDHTPTAWPGRLLTWLEKIENRFQLSEPAESMRARLGDPETYQALRSNVGATRPKQQGRPGAIRDQKTRPGTTIHDPVRSAKPPSPVQVRAAPPFLSARSRAAGDHRRAAPPLRRRTGAHRAEGRERQQQHRGHVIPGAGMVFRAMATKAHRDSSMRRAARWSRPMKRRYGCRRRSSSMGRR
jgi:hypothetical protein